MVHTVIPSYCQDRNGLSIRDNLGTSLDPSNLYLRDVDETGAELAVKVNLPRSTLTNDCILLIQAHGPPAFQFVGPGLSDKRASTMGDKKQFIDDTIPLKETGMDSF